MTRGARALWPAVLVAFSAWLLLTAATSAHAGERHAVAGVDGRGVLGVLAVMTAVGIVYWLSDRDNHPSVGRGHAERVEVLGSSESLEPLTATEEHGRTDTPAAVTLIAVRPRERQSGGRR